LQLLPQNNGGNDDDVILVLPEQQQQRPLTTTGDYKSNGHSNNGYDGPPNVSSTVYEPSSQEHVTDGTAPASQQWRRQEHKQLHVAETLPNGYHHDHDDVNGDVELLGSTAAAAATSNGPALTPTTTADAVKRTGATSTDKHTRSNDTADHDLINLHHERKRQRRDKATTESLHDTDDSHQQQQQHNAAEVHRST
jgi:hypothetical protein